MNFQLSNRRIQEKHRNTSRLDQKTYETRKRGNEEDWATCTSAALLL